MLLNPFYPKIEQYIGTYQQLKKELKWRVSDRILMMVSFIYVVNNKPLNIFHFIKLSDYIKNHVHILSTLKSYQRFTIAAMLDVHFNNSEEAFLQSINLYEELVRQGFSRGAFTYFAAMVLLTNDPERSDSKAIIKRAFTIYKGIKTQHYFLTSTNNYTIAVLLARVDASFEKLLKLSEVYFDRLSTYGFSKGNDLQFLSHILSLQHDVDPNNLIERSIALFEILKKERKRLKPIHYPEVGLLALLDNGVYEIELVLQLEKELNQEKAFKWYKDINFMVAVNFLITDKMKESMILETGIFMTFDALMQAQQTATIAALSNITFTSNSLNTYS